jgi:AraC-like DNA-binding protein
MSKQQIKQLIESRINKDGMVETGVKGVKLFRVTESLRCAPAVYEPTVVAIVNGAKEAILDGKRYVYDSNRYMSCSMSMPVEAGTPTASPDSPLLGVLISLDTRVMTELAIKMESATGAIRKPKSGPMPQAIALARWDDSFTEALLRLLQLGNSLEDTAVLGNSRLRELYYAILKGDAGESVRRAFGVGNEIARAIEYVSSHLKESVTIEDMAAQVGMSRAVFHRKFKEATTMPPIQFAKSMRLNNAAMKIAGGMNVNEAAQDVGYVSSSQFSREFRRMYGQSPRQWTNSKQQTETEGRTRKPAQFFDQLQRAAL